MLNKKQNDVIQAKFPSSNNNYRMPMIIGQNVMNNGRNMQISADNIPPYLRNAKNLK